jgi:hypothetical protein
MLSLVDSDQVNALNAEKQALLNKIIAAGLNSLSGYAANQNAPERQLLDSFVNQSFDKILPCWGLLDDRIKFFVFKTYISEFESFMQAKVSESNVRSN